MFAQAFPLFCIFVSWVAASPYIQSQAIINNSGECPKGVHIIGVRATTEKPGFGLMESIVDKLLSNLSGSDAYPIVYPATGITKNPLRPNLTEYIISETAGVANLTVEIKRFTEECPNNGIVLMGYSQVSKFNRLDSSSCKQAVYRCRVLMSLETYSAVATVTKDGNFLLYSQ